MTDVENNVPVEPVEEKTTEAPQPEEKTQTEEPVATVAQEAAERMVPLSVVREERKKRQELQRKIAELEGSQKLNKYDPNDMDQLMGHPFVQELLVKQAKQELTDYAKDALEKYPNIPQQVKKAILRNARGFVNENTTDVETAKLDLQEYIESIAEEAEAQPTTPKSFPVAATNVAKTDVSGVRPADIERILAKPVDEMSDADMEALEKYNVSQK